jgi:hypothetical protein
MGRCKNTQCGQILPILAVILAGLLAVGALGSDVLYMYWVKDRLQSGTDASALAGATYLTTVNFTGGDPSCGAYSANNAEDAACTYALNNGIAVGEIQSIRLARDGNSITVSSSRAVPALFMRVFGYSQYTVSATATAALQTLGSATSVLPIGLDFTTPYVYGQAIVMHFGGGCGPGCWQGLALQSQTSGSTGGNAFKQNLSIGCDCTLSVGDSVRSEPGATVGPIQQGVGQRTTAGQSIDPAGTWQSHSLDDPRASLVALVDWAGCEGSCSAVVKGFAEVWITGTGFGSSSSDINAVFIRQVSSGTVGSGGISAGALHAVLLQ